MGNGNVKGKYTLIWHCWRKFVIIPITIIIMYKFTCVYIHVHTLVKIRLYMLLIITL